MSRDVDAGAVVVRGHSAQELTLAYIALAGLDVALTAWILALGGVELNGLADRVLQRFGTPGLAGYKVLTVLVVLSCVALVWQRSAVSGRRLAEWAVALSLFPIVVALVQLGARFSPLAAG